MLAILLLLLAEGKRHGIEADLREYPQATPQETLVSVLKAVENKRFDYLTAQLADPAFIDDRVKRLYGGRFEEQVSDTASRFGVTAPKLLKGYLQEGEWRTVGEKAIVRPKDGKEPIMSFRRIGERWYLENRAKP